MNCLPGCITGFVSRLVFLYLWIFTSLVSRAVGDNWIVPLLGLLFLPCTAIVYVWAYAPGIGVTGWGWVWVVIAFLIDLGAHGSGGRDIMKRRRRKAEAPA